MDKNEEPKIEKKIEKVASPAPKKKERYTVKIECLIPATITYQVDAFTAEEALRMTETSISSSPKIDLNHAKRKIKQTAKCYRRGTMMLVHSKTYGR